MKILIAEDAPPILAVLTNMLRGLGHEVVPAADGEQALSILSQTDAPPMALLDWEMPKMDGPEVCRRVREINKTPYIILVTAKAGTGNVVKGLDAGADDYLVKPVNKDELAARIRVGSRIIQLQVALAARVKQLEEAGIREQPVESVV